MGSGERNWTPATHRENQSCEYAQDLSNWSCMSGDYLIVQNVEYAINGRFWNYR